MKRALVTLLAALSAVTVIACSPEATRTRNGGPGADIGNYSKNLPEPSHAPASSATASPTR